MQSKQRIVITVSDGFEVDWRIEIERNGKWMDTVYVGRSASIDDAFVHARHYLLLLTEICNPPC